jgi:hypothetical protein
MRVMSMVMVPLQHETTKVRYGPLPVNCENSIADIRFSDEPRPTVGGEPSARWRLLK